MIWVLQVFFCLKKARSVSSCCSSYSIKKFFFFRFNCSNRFLVTWVLILRLEMKGIWVWFSNLSCLIQILGVIPSTLRMIELLYGNKVKCTDSFLTTYNQTRGCSVTEIGRIIVLVHYGFDCLFALFIVFIYLVAFFERDGWPLTVLVSLFWILVPITLPLIIFTMLTFVIVPHLLIRSQSTTILLYAIWLRLNSGTDDFDVCCSEILLKTLQRIVFFIQVVMLFFENAVEIFISVTLFIQGYWTIPAIIFAVPPGINTIVRLVLVLTEWISNCCWGCSDLMKDVDDTKPNPRKVDPLSYPTYPTATTRGGQLPPLNH